MKHATAPKSPVPAIKKARKKAPAKAPPPVAKPRRKYKLKQDTRATRAIRRAQGLDSIKTIVPKILVGRVVRKMARKLISAETRRREAESKEYGFPIFNFDDISKLAMEGARHGTALIRPPRSMSWQPSALLALHSVAEEHIYKYLLAAQDNATHAGRKTVMAGDLQLAAYHANSAISAPPRHLNILESPLKLAGAVRV